MTILTDKPNPWYQMVVEKKLDSLIWSQFAYTDENKKEIEDCLDKLQTFKVHLVKRSGLRSHALLYHKRGFLPPDE